MCTKLAIIIEDNYYYLVTSRSKSVQQVGYFAIETQFCNILLLSNAACMHIIYLFLLLIIFNPKYSSLEEEEEGPTLHLEMVTEGYPSSPLAKLL